MVAQFIGPLDWSQTFAVLFLAVAFVALFVLPQIVRLRRLRADRQFQIDQIKETRVARDTQLIDARRPSPSDGGGY